MHFLINIHLGGFICKIFRVEFFLTFEFIPCTQQNKIHFLSSLYLFSDKYLYERQYVIGKSGFFKKVLFISERKHKKREGQREKQQTPH